MKILILAPYPLNEAPSQRFRFEHFLNLFEQYGHEYDFRPFWSKSAWQVLYERGRFIAKLYHLTTGFIRRLMILPGLYRFDLVFIHREAAPIGPPLLEWVIIKLFGKPVIYDFDDAIWMQNTSTVNKVVALLKQHNKVKNICRWSWKISAGNAYLAQYAANSNKEVAVIPTVVDTDNHHNQVKVHSKQAQITIGWTGTHSTATYLNDIVPVIERLAANYNIKLQVISNQKPDIDLTVMHFIPWQYESEIAQLYAFDIGIMPLQNAEWEKGKCGFKAIQYMSLGIPCVASPVGVNTTLITHGVNGFLAKDTAEWYECLSRLIEDHTLRNSIGMQARKSIVQNYSVSAMEERFFSLFA